MKIFTRDW